MNHATHAVGTIKVWVTHAHMIFSTISFLFNPLLLMNCDSVGFLYHFVGASTEPVISIVQLFHRFSIYSFCPFIIFPYRDKFVSSSLGVLFSLCAKK